MHDAMAMPGNPKDSKWYATPKEKRKRPHIQLTLSPLALSLLKSLAKKYKFRSQSMFVEHLIINHGQQKDMEENQS